MTYRFALDSEYSVPRCERLDDLFELRGVRAKCDGGSDLSIWYQGDGINAPEVVGIHGWGHGYLDACSDMIAGGTAELHMLGLPKGHAEEQEASQPRCSSGSRTDELY